MPPKIRNPFMSWLLTVITGGIYLIFWTWLVANELNTAEQRTVFKVDFWRKAFLDLMFMTLAGFVLLIAANNPLLIFVSFLCLLSLFIHVQLLIGNYIQAKNIELNLSQNYSNAMSIFLLWFVANLGVAYMQSGINRIIRHERARILT